MLNVGAHYNENVFNKFCAKVHHNVYKCVKRVDMSYSFTLKCQYYNLTKIDKIRFHKNGEFNHDCYYNIKNGGNYAL